jgi:hypothetical protein
MYRSIRVLLFDCSNVKSFWCIHTFRSDRTVETSKKDAIVRSTSFGRSSSGEIQIADIAIIESEDIGRYIWQGWFCYALDYIR